MAHCMEVEWMGSDAFAHKGVVLDWQDVMGHASNVRLVGHVDFGPWTSVYEVEQPGDRSRLVKTRYLVSD
jgi:hypothetical protein